MRDVIVKTDNLSYFEQVVDFLSKKSGEQMCLVWGLPGTGKSSAAKYLAVTVGGQYVSCRPGLSGMGLMRLILANYDAKCNSFAAGIDKVISFLKASKQPLFVDEIDFIVEKYEVLEALRTIHDEAGVPVIVLGMPGIQNKVKVHKQLCDRIHFMEFGSASFSDVKRFTLERCEVSIEDDHLKSIFSFAKGNLRLVKRCLEYAENFCSSMGLKALSSKDWGEMALLPEYAIEPAPKMAKSSKKGGK
jgi:DNA transposition AAA+ family ATPase